ncbi:Pyruvate kinase isozymes M1/M2 [Heterocephalus glaber]|uniref:Pyruvate kinase n=1 Tax=Heterocephalus glaber TaxID=10181 RepID=G5BVD8_HETGA|nr:Pyruvate kinase isozymes M1/M2 [Heterocephalus glaber]
MMSGCCNHTGKPVICATQMLEGMELRSSRAKGSLETNAVLAGAGCTMLSQETAKGNDPLEAVCMQHLTAQEAHTAIYHLQLFEELCLLAPITSNSTEAASVGVARYPVPPSPLSPPPKPPDGLYQGIFPMVCKDPVQQAWTEEVDLHVNLAKNICKAPDFFKMGCVVIVLTRWHPSSGFTNTMCVMTALELLSSPLPVPFPQPIH